MRDPRMLKLAKNLVNYSCRTQPGENVLVEATGIPADFVTALVDEIHLAGGNAFVQINDPKVTRSLVRGASDAQVDLWAELDALRMSRMQAYIGVRGGSNSFEMSDVGKDDLKRYMVGYNEPVHSKIRVPKTKWVVLRYPLPAMAQLAGKSTDAFEEFYFNVCNLDYGKMSRAMDPLVELMNKTDRVRLSGKGLDLTFSIKDIPAIKCAGECNIPDGEVYTAPVKDSVNGVITYNTPSLYQGLSYENIALTFKDGKIVEATANHHEKINEIFNTDDGARYVGEFAIGVNPYINEPMKDTLFDEKIAGSFHFTPGNCYDEAPNGNKSAIHWDLVFIQTPQYGGGEMYFDDVLVRKDGRFVLPQLEMLNPENLK